MTGQGGDLPLPGGSRLDVAAPQVDLAPDNVQKQVAAAGWPGGQRVDQRRRVGRAPPGQHRLGCGLRQAHGMEPAI